MPQAQPQTAVERLREYRKSSGRTPRLHKASISIGRLQFAVFRTEDPGTGALPLICVNGGLIFDHSLLWPALAPLASTRQLIFYDQRGRGASAVPPGARASRIEFDAADLAALPEALGLESCHLLGHSWGGGIALLSTQRQQARLASLTLINSVGLSSDWLETLTESAARRLSAGALDRLRSADAAVRPGSPSAADPAALSEYAAAIYPAWFAFPELTTLLAPPRSTSVTGAAVSARLRRDGYDWRDNFQPLTIPTLLLHGTADLLPVSLARATRDALGSAATLVEIADAGHNPFWEQPSIVFTAINQFLAAADPTTHR